MKNFLISVCKIIGGVVVFFVVGGMGLAMYFHTPAPPSTPPTKNTPSLPTKPVILTSAEHLAQAKKALGEAKPNKDPLKASYGRTTDAKRHLAAIQPGDKEFEESQNLKREVEKREKEIDRISKIIAINLMIEQREAMAKRLEQNYLKKGLDVYISLNGKDKSTMKLKYVLFSRPLIHNLINDSEFTGSLRTAGFTKVIFTDGYDNTWTVDL